MRSLSSAGALGWTRWTGEGLPAALEGVDVIIDATDGGTIHRAKATAFFTDVTENLQTIGQAQGVSRLVTLSIVGLERLPGFGYYEAKLAQESGALAGPLPVSIVRATQFHEFPAQILSCSAWGPDRRGAGHEDSARRGASSRGGAGRDSGRAGPGDNPRDRRSRREESGCARSRHCPGAGQRTIIVPLRVPGRAGRAMRAGKQMPQSAARIVGPTFEEWLSGRDFAAMSA